VQEPIKTESILTFPRESIFVTSSGCPGLDIKGSKFETSIVSHLSHLKCNVFSSGFL